MGKKIIVVSTKNKITNDDYCNVLFLLHLFFYLINGNKKALSINILKLIKIQSVSRKSGGFNHGMNNH
jgi:hypothetical protein